MRSDYYSYIDQYTGKKVWALKDLGESLDEKYESTEWYFIKQIAGMVAVQKILAPQLHVKSKIELENLIAEFIVVDKPIIRKRLHPSMEFIQRVADYMDVKKGHLHIKQFMPDDIIDRNFQIIFEHGTLLNLWDD